MESQGKKMQVTKKYCAHAAFTLIELLIVIAIIAILALIALPNFLEAQIRAKVSRVKSDMRTMRLAMECYVVDCNIYPPDNGGQGGDYRVWQRLTTPVAYLTSMPESSFNEREYPEAYNSFRYWRGPLRTYDRGALQSDILYRMSSVGPDQFNDGAPEPVDIVGRTPTFLNKLYDPTNGTLSGGDVVASNQAIY